MIKANPKWKYVGTYVDDGFSGTNTEHRPGFNMMMRDAMEGKIDLIITKAVSRFARNLIDCIDWVRRLQKHDPPIAVFFEQENLNTLDNTSNIILFVLAMVAEEESHMKSEAMLLSLEWRFSRGRFLIPPLLGYDKIEMVDNDGIKKKMLVINEDQAVVIRYMYYSLLNGQSPAEIAENLTAMGIETGGRKKDGTKNTQWTTSSIVSKLRNERYCGDVLARKTWTPDFHDHKSKRNDGKKNKYYHPGHHEAIVTRAQWNAAQRILNSTRYNHSGSYKAMQVVESGVLTGYISVNRAWAGFDLNEYYRVSSIVLGIQEGELDANLNEEFLPERGYKLSSVTEENGVQRIARQLSAAEQAMKDQLEGNTTNISEEYTEPDIGKTKRSMEKQFQVVSGDFFTHVLEPTVTIRRNSLSFNKTCVNLLAPLANDDSEQYAEILLNPIERILAVRPCSKSHPNGVLWKDYKKKSCSFGSSVFSRMLYEMLDWNEDCNYRIPASLRVKDNERILFFDLENVIANKSKANNAVEDLERQLSEAENKALESNENEGLGNGSFFFAADDEEPQSIEDIEVIQQRLLDYIALEKVTFGTPLRDYTESYKLNAIDESGLWDIMAEARTLDSDHRVENTVIRDLEDMLLERNTDA